MALVRDLNRLYRAERALHQLDYDPAGFLWIDCGDRDQSVISFVRFGRETRGRLLLFVLQLHARPAPGATGWGCPDPGGGEVLNTDSAHYGGINLGNGGGCDSRRSRPWHGQPHSLVR